MKKCVWDQDFFLSGAVESSIKYDNIVILDTDRKVLEKKIFIQVSVLIWDKQCSL